MLFPREKGSEARRWQARRRRTPPCLILPSYPARTSAAASYDPPTFDPAQASSGRRLPPRLVWTGERVWGAHKGSSAAASRHGAWAYGAGPCGATHLE